MKNKLREIMKLKRDRMAKGEVEEKSAAIAERLEKTREYREATAILLYAAKGNEVQTRQLIQNALTSGKKVMLPLTNTRLKAIEIGEVESYSELRKGAFGILEPQKETTEGNVDVAVVPGLAFDRHGNRLGYGFGYYDKLLSRLKTTKIGLAYDFQVAERLPREGHDHPMDIIVTESEVIRAIEHGRTGL